MKPSAELPHESHFASRSVGSAAAYCGSGNLRRDECCVALETGFDVLSIGSLTVTASKYALPDAGFMSLDDMADCVRNVRLAIPEST